MNAYDLVALLNAEKLTLVSWPWHADLVNEHNAVVAHFCAYANDFAQHRWVAGKHDPRSRRQCA